MVAFCFALWSWQFGGVYCVFAVTGRNSQPSSEIVSMLFLGCWLGYTNGASDSKTGPYILSISYSWDCVVGSPFLSSWHVFSHQGTDMGAEMALFNHKENFTAALSASMPLDCVVMP